MVSGGVVPGGISRTTGCVEDEHLGDGGVQLDAGVEEDLDDAACPSTVCDSM